MQRLVDEVPQTTGLKHSSPVFANLLEFVGMGLDAFIGSGKLMLPAMTVGAVGSVDGPLCAAPELWMDVWNAYQAGDLTAAKQAQERATDFHRTVAQFGYLRQCLGRGWSAHRDGVRRSSAAVAIRASPRNARRCWRRWRPLGSAVELAGRPKYTTVGFYLGSRASRPSCGPKARVPRAAPENRCLG